MRSRLFFCLMTIMKDQAPEERITKLLVKAVKNDQMSTFLGICSAGVDCVPKDSMRRILIEEVPAFLELSETKKMISWISQALQAMTKTEDTANI